MMPSWQILLGLVVALVGGVWAVGRVLVGQYDRRLDERFAARDKTDSERKVELATRLDRLETRQADEIDEMQRVDERLSERIGRMEAALAAAPTKDDLNQVHSRIDEIAANIAGLRGEFQGVAVTVSLIHRKMLEG
ncbi:hypothetical protein [Parachitinimonas caeni]|uniref:DUF2730 family protein n=1 Tax=Parachitinimonas caeni TaxID=3031301 RepID=A0ABT7DWN9_9NEIS|nr:hypothetical protein [Parachitinimonas caeni]MDK2124477.1 hypothetical protein [Parachitinimonas caeni]